MFDLNTHLQFLQLVCNNVFSYFVSGKLLPCSIPSSYSKLEPYKDIKSDEGIDGVYSLQYSPDGSILAIGTGNEAMRVSWNTFSIIGIIPNTCFYKHYNYNYILGNLHMRWPSMNRLFCFCFILWGCHAPEHLCDNIAYPATDRS